MNSMVKMIDKLFSWLAMVLMGGIFLVYTANIFCRYFFAFNLDWADDIIRLFFIWDVFLGSAVMYSRREHLAMEFVLKKMGEKAKERMSVVHDIFQIGFLGVVIWQGLYMAKIRMGIPFTGIESLPTGYAYLALPIAATFMVVVSVKNLVEICTGKRALHP
jgi:TRAP-type C4-dicarboxylate transport system permease small subunit